MQFQVPQFIETEDKIVGPFSLKQFLYVGIALMISFLLYFTVEVWLFVLGSSFSVILAMSFAFVKIEGRPLIHVLGAAMAFFWKPQTYIFQPEKPGLPKENALIIEGVAAGISLENILSGAALHGVWRDLQAGIPQISKKKVFEGARERYQIFQRLSGERRAARRIDYR